MKTETATYAKIHFGSVLANAALEPIVIEKSGHSVAVLLSYEEYQRMRMLEDQFWSIKAKAARKKGFIGTKDSEKLLQELLDAKD